MSAIRTIVNRIEAPSATQAVGATAAKKRPLSLFDVSSLVTPRSVPLVGGSTMSLPTLSQDQAGHVQKLFAGMTPAQQDDVSDASDALGQALFAVMQQTPGGQMGASLGGDDDDGDNDGVSFGGPTNMVGNAQPMMAPAAGGAGSNSQQGDGKGQAKGGEATASDASGQGVTHNMVSRAVIGTAAATGSSGQVGAYQATPSGLTTSTQNAMSTYGSAKPTANYDDRVLATAYMGVTGLQNQMANFAQGMSTRQNAQTTLTNDVAELRQAATEVSGSQTATVTVHTADESGNLTASSATLTHDQLLAKATDLEATATSMSSSTATDQIKLQSMVQNYSNALSMMSNIMKTAYDTTKNTVGNIHY